MEWLHFKENSGQGQYKWLAEYYRDLTLLVFSLAGLNLLDRKLPNRVDPEPGVKQ